VKRGLTMTLVGMLLTGMLVGPAVASAEGGSSTAIQAYVAHQGTFTVVDANTVSVKANASWRLTIATPDGSVVSTGGRTIGTFIEMPSDAQSISLVIQ